VHFVLIEGCVVAEAVAAEVFEGFEENCAECFLVIFGDGTEFLGRLEGFIALRVAYFG